MVGFATLALFVSPAIARADCNDFAYNVDLAWHAYTDYDSYVEEGNDDMAQATLDNIQHWYDDAGNDVMDCDGDRISNLHYYTIGARLDAREVDTKNDADLLFTDLQLMRQYGALQNGSLAGTYAALKAILKQADAKLGIPYKSPDKDD